MTNEEHDKDMIESIEMWLHEIEPKWVEKELAWLEELRNRLLEEDTPNGLEEAADEHVNNIAYCGDDIELEKEQSKRDFIAGAKWQKQHDAELIEIAYNDGITIGMTKQKEQMMKDAVEGDIGMTLHDKRADLYVRSKGYLPESLGIKCNDKVRIIIVKEN